MCNAPRALVGARHAVPVPAQFYVLLSLSPLFSFFSIPYNATALVL
jgi:hypothetical protein